MWRAVRVLLRRLLRLLRLRRPRRRLQRRVPPLPCGALPLPRGDGLPPRVPPVRVLFGAPLLRPRGYSARLRPLPFRGRAVRLPRERYGLLPLFLGQDALLPRANAPLRLLFHAAPRLPRVPARSTRDRQDRSPHAVLLSLPLRQDSSRVRRLPPPRVSRARSPRGGRVLPRSFPARRPRCEARRSRTRTVPAPLRRFRRFPPLRGGDRPLLRAGVPLRVAGRIFPLRSPRSRGRARLRVRCSPPLPRRSYAALLRRRTWRSSLRSPRSPPLSAVLCAPLRLRVRDVPPLPAPSWRGRSPLLPGDGARSRRRCVSVPGYGRLSKRRRSRGGSATPRRSVSVSG